MPTRDGRRRFYQQRDIMESILVVNAGSSSVKFQVFGLGGQKELQPLLRGEMEGIGVRPRLKVRNSGDALLVDKTFSPESVPDAATAIRTAGAWLSSTQELNLVAVGHRVVHGGPEYDHPVLIDEVVLSRLERYVPLAPLHQPSNLAPIHSIRERYPGLPQVACFDTAFHRGHSPEADHYAIPQTLYAEGVRRYGFHGLSYEYVANRLQEIAPDIAGKRVIIAHLGSGASMCALLNARSVESTMGFTALDGLPMGTRPGQIDPGVVLYLQREKGMSTDAVQKYLYGNCGLKGLSGVSNDVRELLASSDPGAKLALDHFIYRIALHAGMLASAIGGLDAFVFTAGIGERSAAMRARIADKLAWLDVAIDQTANAAARQVISTDQSKVRMYVVPTNEELMIARHTVATLSAIKHVPAELKRSA
jgi:acetate kinase